MNKLSAAFAAILVCGLGTTANAASYQYNGSDISGFSLLGQSPGSTVLFSGLQFNSTTGKYEFVAFTPKPTKFTVGSTGSKNFSGYDGVTVSLNNSSFQDINTNVFVATQNGSGYDVYVGDKVTVGDNDSATLSLDFGNAHKYQTDSHFNIIHDNGTGHALDDVSSVVAYGFGVSTDKGVFVHAAVPEPGTLVLFGAGLLGLAMFLGLRRRNAIKA